MSLAAETIALIVLVDGAFVVSPGKDAVLALVVAPEVWSHVKALTIVEVLKLEGIGAYSKNSKDKFRVHEKVLLE